MTMAEKKVESINKGNRKGLSLGRNATVLMARRMVSKKLRIRG